MQNKRQSGTANPKKPANIRLFRRFKRSEDGVAAIEFGMVALPFLILLFAILETAIGFFAAQVFESGVDSVGRSIRTGQSRSSSYTLSQMKTAICGKTLGMFKCGDIQLDVRTYTTFPNAPLTTPRLNGNLDTAAFQYDTGLPNSIVIVRAYYEWPIFLDYLWQSSGSLSNGKRLFVATAAFKNEPFSLP